MLNGKRKLGVCNTIKYRLVIQDKVEVSYWVKMSNMEVEKSIKPLY